MNVAVICEESGEVRDAFIRRGHNAVSCDLRESSVPGPHIVGDCLKQNWRGFDLLICHPPCTYLCNSGGRWLYKGGRKVNGRCEARWALLREGARFFNAMASLATCPIAIENPVMHEHAAELVGRRQDQVIQPWQFGDGFVKATGLWLSGLPLLKPTNIVEGRVAFCHGLGPSKDRAMLRSKTYPGIANAMAEQWGGL